MIDGHGVLVTGGTGSFGKELARIVLSEHKPSRFCIYSRDEAKQLDMRQAFPAEGPVRYFIGDVRDRRRLERALHGIDTLIHAAALKQVPTAEYEPAECVKTNVLGTMNVVDAAIDAGVKRVLLISTDKCCHPVNLYGATKAVAEKLIVQGNSYSGALGCRFSAVRYGNVFGSRGSVVPVWREQAKSGRIALTDRRMTRYWLTLEQGVRFSLRALNDMQGGEIFVPKIPSFRVEELAGIVAPGCTVDETGIRPGEKLHETLVSADEARHTIEQEDRYIICPPFVYWPDPWEYWSQHGGPTMKAYTSDGNDQWLTEATVKNMLVSI